MLSEFPTGSPTSARVNPATPALDNRVRTATTACSTRFAVQPPVGRISPSSSAV
jgi:hypothetical protein